mmetsp:Transcript_71313/g.183835  ORF Transcript_71313/g.183835 Transcript_71313/m.183835 type:complete len:491 (-) Transcript_71313:169-1641(-)
MACVWRPLARRAQLLVGLLGSLAAMACAAALAFLRRRILRQKGPQRRHSSFRAQYEALASKDTGFFCEPPAFPTTGSFGQIVILADRAPELYAVCDAAQTRAFIREHLDALGSAERLAADAAALRRCEQAGIFAALVYIRHMFHQGDPSQPPVQSLTAVQDGDEVEEPVAIGRVLETLTGILGVRPYLNLTNWIFFNWHMVGEGGREEALQMRFSWFRGEARPTEANFWRAFAVSEMCAAPMYGDIASLFENLGDDVLTVESLQKIQKVVRKIRKVFTDSVTTQLIDVDYFNRMQNTAHFGSASAGAGGFQLPFILVLDALLGLTLAGMPAKTQRVWEENLGEVPAPMRALITDVVRPEGQRLREYVQRSSSAALQAAFNGVVKEFVMWRATHRSRASQWLETSSVTTGRINDDMENDVKGTFMKEMDHMIQSTKACTLRQAGTLLQPPGQPAGDCLGTPKERLGAANGCPIRKTDAQMQAHGGICPFLK